MNIKRIIANLDKQSFSFYMFFSILLIITLIVLSTFKFTQARYESNTTINISPTLAFFIVDVQNTSGQIKLDGLIPRDEPYLFTFEVSNFNDEKKANVDLTYSIELITTTNMPLNFKIFKGSNMEQNKVDSDTVTTDDNGVFYRHLVIDDVSVMNYSNNCTDTYTLWVEFPKTYMNNPDAYAGIIDLVDIKINAEQVV